MLRGGFGLDWRRDEILPRGVLRRASAAADADFYRSRTTPARPTASATAQPSIGAELRWPLVRRGGGATHVIEPIVQVISTGDRRRPGRRAERGQPAPGIRRDQPLRPQPLSRHGPIETGLRANIGRQLCAPRPRRLGPRLHARPGVPRRGDRRVPGGHGPRRQHVGLRHRLFARVRRGAHAGEPRALRPRLQLPPQRVGDGLRRRARRPARRPISSSPRTTATRSSARSPRRASSRSRRATASCRTGRCAASGATTSRRTATCAPAAGSPTATNAPRSTFRSRAATPLRLMSRPRRRSASAVRLPGLGAKGDRDWPARGCSAADAQAGGSG